jgi:hypothetical protein
MKVGDNVRVIAGSPAYEDDGTSHMAPKNRSFGLPLKTVKDDGAGDAEVSIGDTGFTEWIGKCYLEPWNDKEHWNGRSWVANPNCEPVPTIPDSVWVGGVEYVRKVDVATPELTMAQEYAQLSLDDGVRYSRFDGIDKRFETKTISATADGDLVTIVERVISME